MVRWRTIPIYPELYRWLKEAFDPEQEYCLFGITGTPSNIRDHFGRIIKKAGLQPWPRIWHNLRASRDTDLSEFLPAHAVAALMGNSAETSNQHYKMLTPGQIDALKVSTLSPATSPPETKNRGRDEVGTKVGMQPPATADNEGNDARLICLFPVVYVNPEEFENAKHPRQDSQQLQNCRQLPSQTH